MIEKLNMQFPEKRAFITGAGSGLGKAMALQLAKHGWKITVTDFMEIPLKQTVAEINQLGGTAYPFLFDVSKRNDFAEAFQQAINNMGGLDLMVNNAGVGDGAPFLDYTLDNCEWMIGINQMGVLYGSHFAATQMRKQQLGCIINISSAASIAQLPEMSMYNMTKSAVRSLSDTIYAELKQYNIHVLCVMPTFFKTNILQHARSSQEGKERGQKMIDKSNITADQMAEKIFDFAARKKVHLVFPTDAKLIYFISRFMPVWFLKLKAALYGNVELREKYLNR